MSDIPALQVPQRELNRALTQLSRILEVSGNPISRHRGRGVVGEHSREAGRRVELPQDTKANLLDLLQGGGIRLHIDFIELVYRCLHDISEAPRAAYGGIDMELSGTALEIELQSLLQKVRRKRTIRTAAYRQRNEMMLRLHAQFAREDVQAVNHRIIWGNVLPQDRAGEAQNEQIFVQSGVHSRRTAMDCVGIRDPEREFNKWLEERKAILSMNNEYRAKNTAAVREREIPPADIESI